MPEKKVRYFRVRNHSELQHYKSGPRSTRPPSWIKWHLSCRSSYNFTRLTDAQRWHCVGLAMLAAQAGNHLPDDTRWLARELPASGRVDLRPLLVSGFIEWCDCQDCKREQAGSGENASSVLALTRSQEQNRIEENREEPPPPSPRAGARVGGSKEGSMEDHPLSLASALKDAMGEL